MRAAARVGTAFGGRTVAARVVTVRVVAARVVAVRVVAVRVVAVRVVALLGLIALALSGCANRRSLLERQPLPGSATASTVASVQQVRITVGDDYRFHPSTIIVHRGMVRILLVHTGTTGAPHNWQLTNFPADFVPLIQAGESAQATFMAPAVGTYRFECTIHVQQGQIGTMIVAP